MLLRNEGGLLPLDADALTSVAVIGPLADSPRDTLGPWVFDFDLDETVTVLEGLRTRLGRRRTRRARARRPASCSASSARSSTCSAATPRPTPTASTPTPSWRRAVDLARDSDVAVVVVGEWQNMIGEQASRSSLELPGRQLELLQAVVATGTPVVLVVMNGRPLDLRWADEHVPGDPRRLVPRHPGRHRRREPAARRRQPRRQAALHLAAHRRPGPDDPGPHDLPRAGEPGPPLLGRAEHAALPLRARPVLLLLRVRRPRRRPRHDDPRRHHHDLGHGDQHRRPGGRRGGAALPAPAPRHRVTTGPRAQGLRAGHPGGGGVARGLLHGRPGRAALLERRRPRLGHRRLDLRRLGRRQLHRDRGDDLRGQPPAEPSTGLARAEWPRDSRWSCSICWSSRSVASAIATRSSRSR